MIPVTRETAEKIMVVFRESFLNQDLEAFLDLFDENVSFEFPYAPEPYVKKLTSKSELRAHLLSLQGVFKIHSFSEPVIHRSVDASVFTAEFCGHGVMNDSGQPYDQQYISVIELQEGKIIRYQDYWNPLSLG
ncbi:nuclear transport factor 2 family protein [Saccharibacillus sp. JS10]|uniref:nuclear transport factor 2 family protein n=1 Tax=Saccharibacillus sp. JS10 TaxID=2950552 RepID=UPI00210C2C33|nr:nuclear transport factor 2 family protein [Saccharibacillus sp. JS10]MCQ4088644.1 nuclear transport factor 2 family protein [Saccharibacillus sp. JS10]